MQSPGPVSPPSSGSFSTTTSSNGVQMDPVYFYDEAPLELFQQGAPVLFKMDPQAMLYYIMHSLDPSASVVFNELDAGEYGYKYSVKMDVSALRSVSGESLSEAFVVGDPSSNRDDALSKGAWVALKYLHEIHRVNVLDFSSRLADRCEEPNAFKLACDGFGALDRIFAKWELTVLSFENLSVSLEGKYWDEVFFGHATERGHVISFLGNSLATALAEFDQSTSQIRSEMNEIQSYLRNYEKAIAVKGQLQLTKAPFHIVDMPSKEVLQDVMIFLGLAQPKFTSTPGGAGYGHVYTKVELIFPEVELYQFGGPITINGEGSSLVEAKEQAAFKALSFIEKHFPITIVDCNYSKRKKAMSQQKKLIKLLSKIVGLVDRLKKLWSQLSTEISGQQALFSMEPSSLFSGPASEGQIDAFRLCASGLDDLAKYSANGYALCATEFDMMVKLNWQFLLLKIKLNN